MDSSQRVSTRALENLLAILVAVVIVAVIKAKLFDLQALVGPIDPGYFGNYTAYYPGLKNIRTHELFDPEYRSTRKIVILGASAADSIGCDASWSFPDPTRNPDRNAHASCSISAQLNELLRVEGYTRWRSFNLARNGSKLAAMLYTYSVAMETKPDVIVWGETFPYFIKSNAGATDLTADMYRDLDRTFDAERTRPLWLSLRSAIEHGAAGSGWSPPEYAHHAANGDSRPVPRDKFTPLDLLTFGYTRLRNALKQEDGPPLPIKRYPFHPEPQTNASPASGFVNPDPDMAYFRGFGIIGESQKAFGGHMVMYFLPQYDRREDKAYLAALDHGEFGRVLDGFDIGHKSLVNLPLALEVETYDGVHQTRAGNRRIAAEILKDLVARGIVH